MAGFTISMHFQQFEDLKFQNFSAGTCRTPPPRPPLKALCLRHLDGVSFQHFKLFGPGKFK